MNLEKMLIEKTFYEGYMDGIDDQPVQVLGALYAGEQEKETTQLSNIRFAQGEVYFLSKDYETAIFKWKKVANDLSAWARKNTADANYELGQLAVAEDLYKSVATEDKILQAEVALQLFSLYLDRGKNEAASETIKELISSNPDYPNATKIGRMFFEDQGDWQSATDLAVNEGIRTQSTEWFDALEAYTETGATKNNPPSYFSSVLRTIYTADPEKFGQLASAFWRSYRDDGAYIEWIQEFNLLLSGIQGLPAGLWLDLSELYKEAYLNFVVSGEYSIASLADIMPPLLINWTRIADSQNVSLAASALLAWGGKFPSGISAEIIAEAESVLAKSERTENGFAAGLSLLKEIAFWADKHGLKLSPRLEWIAGELADFRTRHVVAAGMSGNIKEDFLRLLLGNEFPEEASSGSSPLAFRYKEEAEFNIVNDQEVNDGVDMSELVMENSSENAKGGKEIYSFMLPVPFLKEGGVSLIDLPVFGDEGLEAEALEYIQLADCLLFAVDVQTPMTDAERIVLGGIREMAPGLPIHFLLGFGEDSIDMKENVRLFDDAYLNVKSSFPDSEIITISTGTNKNRLYESLLSAIIISSPKNSVIGTRTDKLLILIRNTLSLLLEQRANQEKRLKETVESHEDMAAKLNGAINQVSDIEAEKINTIQKSYRSVLNEMKADLSEEIPRVLRGTAGFINENSDFRTIHLSLNDEMNRVLQEYLNQVALPKFRNLLEVWIESSSAEFNRIQEFLNEMSEGFNALYGEGWINLDCDFSVLKDWDRDAGRMTSNYKLDKVNVLLKRTPSQILLKGAGKLLGSLPQNNAMLYNRYKTFVENEDYSETTKLLINRFFTQFEVFLNAIGRDVALFFKKPEDVLYEKLQETQTEISNCKDLLSRMKKNPESFHDPMALFGIRLRQLEWLDMTRKGTGSI